MSKQSYLEIVVAGGLLILSGGVAYFALKNRKVVAAAGVSPAAALPRRVAPVAVVAPEAPPKIVYLPGQTKTVTVYRNSPAPSPSATDAGNALTKQLLLMKVPGTGADVAGVLGYGAVRGAGVASQAAGNALTTVATPGINPDAAPGGFRESLGNSLKGFSQDLDQAASSLGVAAGANFAVRSIGIRGKSKKEQAAIFGQADVAAIQGIVQAIPLAGQVISPVIGILAGTYEGKRVVKAAGVATEQGYTFQRMLATGYVSEAFSGGGHSHKERMIYAARQQAADAIKLEEGRAAESNRIANALLAETQNSAFQKSQDAQAKVNATVVAAARAKDPNLTKTLTTAQYEAAFGNVATQQARAKEDAARAIAKQKADTIRLAGVGSRSEDLWSSHGNPLSIGRGYQGNI